MVKTCSKCGRLKPLDQFHRRARAADGHVAACKACRTREPRSRTIAAQYRDEHRVELRAAHRERAAQTRRRVARMKLALSCVDCGWSPSTLTETTLLHFDHVDPATKHTSRNKGAYLPSWSWPRIERELALCVPRCKTCHGRRSALQGQELRRHSA